MAICFLFQGELWHHAYVEVKMGNRKPKIRKNILANGILSAMSLSGCGKGNVRQEEALVDGGDENAVMGKNSMPEENKGSFLYNTNIGNSKKEG